MKKTISILLLVFTMLSTYAQTAENAYLKVSYLGHTNGKYTFLFQEKQTGCSREDYTSTFGGGVVITAINPSDNPTTFLGGSHVDGTSTTVYFTGAWKAGATFTFQITTICNSGLGNNDPITLTLNTEGANLPTNYKSGSFKSTYHEQGEVDFEFTLLMEQNIDHYEILEGSDTAIASAKITGKGDQSIGRTYNNNDGAFIFYTQVACFGCVGIVLLVGIGLGALKNRRTLMAMSVLLIIGGTSCSKTNDVKAPTKPGSGTHVYILKEVDKDGNVYILDRISVKVN